MCNKNVLEDQAIKLTKEEYEYCIVNFDKMECKEMLFKGHIKWALRISRKYFSNRFTRDEIDAEGLVGLWKAIRMYDPTKGYKLITFMTPVVRNQVNKYIRKFKDTPVDESLNTTIKSDKDRGKSDYFIDMLEDEKDYIIAHENKMIFEEAINILPDIEKDVFISYYIRNIPQRDIVVRGTTSQVNISRILKRARGRIAIYLAKGYVRKGRLTEEEVDEALNILAKDKKYFI